MWELFGLDAESQAKGEKSALNSRRTEFETWDLGDRLRSALTGVTKEQLETLSGKLADTELEEIYGSRASRAKGNLGHLTSAYQGIKGQTKGEIISQIEEDEQKGTVLQRTVASNPRLDVSTIAPTAAVGDIVQAGGKATIKHADEKETKATQKEESRYRDSQDLIALQFANSAADRQADREYRRDQQAYQNRKLDMQEARLDRKDRQAAIQSMMAGLAQLGASIAI